MNPDPIAQAMQDLLNRNLAAAEIERLKAEVAALRKELADAQENYHLVNGHYARLKAEVEKLEKTITYLNDTLNQYALDDWRMKEHVERLTKAGDAMAVIIKYHPDVKAVDAVPDLVKRWHAAKEGKGQP